MIGFLLLLILSFGDISHAYAQTCTPTCTNGETCEYLDVARTQTACATSVSEVTVTAQKSGSSGTFASIVNNIVSIVSSLVIPLLYALAFLYFVLGLTRFVFADGEENRSKGKQVMMYGLIGLIVIFSVWGLVDVLLRTLTSFAGT